MLHCQMIQAGEIQAIVGDAARNGLGGPQYCGLWSLTSRHRNFNAFGNAYAGLIPSEIRGKAPALEVVDEHTAALTRKADGAYPSDCRATYRVEAPHYVEHTLTFADRANLLRSYGGPGVPGYRESGSCCYMNSPEDPRICFRSGGEWLRYISPEHGVGSNIAPSYVPDAELEVLPGQDQERRPFHVDRIPRRFDEPFYYGRLGEMVLVLIFDQPRWLRFFCSPSGGGPSLLPGKACPAWDYLWAIPESEYRVGREYTFRVRVAYKPFVSDEDVLDEYRRAYEGWGVARPGKDLPSFSAARG
jgi:hypothetical protein